MPLLATRMHLPAAGGASRRDLRLVPRERSPGPRRGAVRGRHTTLSEATNRRPEASTPDVWRPRLRDAIDRSGFKHSLIALDAGITPQTPSPLPTAQHHPPPL